MIATKTPQIINSASMNLVIPLVLFLLSAGLCYNQGLVQTKEPCYSICPKGFYKTGPCAHQDKMHRCKKCEDGEFTNGENLEVKCEKCRLCKHLEVTVKDCSYDQDTECDCPQGHYYYKDPDFGDCKECPTVPCEEAHEYRDCNRKCPRNVTDTTLATPTTISAGLMGTAKSGFTGATATRTEASNTPHTWNWMSLTLLVGVIVMTFLVFSWLLLLSKIPLRYLAACPCWSANKDPKLPVQDPIFNEQRSPKSCCPTTLNLKIAETPSMMPLNQSLAPQEHPKPSYVNPLLPEMEHEANRQSEHSEHWPAIILYAIIKEVPLRRWKEFLRLLSVADQQLERVELEAGLGLGSMERQYQMLRLWSQRSSASLNDVFSALHYMDLSGCAQLLQESLDNLHWRSDGNQGAKASRNYTENYFNNREMEGI